MSLSLLAKQPLTWDSEAATYLTAVENADTMSLEPAVARAINTFIIDCKVRGIWNAIKSCCLLCGARSLNGAIRPLKGAAPTNTNFTNNDYDRKNGITNTSGSGKILDSNILGTSNPTNNNHVSIYYTDLAPIAASSYMLITNTNINGAAGININWSGAFQNTMYSMCNASTNSLHGRIRSDTRGFTGVTRDNGNNYTARFEQSNRIISVIATGQRATTYKILSNELGTGSVAGRINFYSIGESLDLRLLEQCITKYVNSINLLI